MTADNHANAALDLDALGRWSELVLRDHDTPDWEEAAQIVAGLIQRLREAEAEIQRLKENYVGACEFFLSASAKGWPVSHQPEPWYAEVKAQLEARK
jgi:hypothetical protein